MNESRGIAVLRSHGYEGQLKDHKSLIVEWGGPYTRLLRIQVVMKRHENESDTMGRIGLGDEVWSIEFALSSVYFGDWSIFMMASIPLTPRPPLG